MFQTGHIPLPYIPSHKQNSLLAVMSTSVNVITTYGFSQAGSQTYLVSVPLISYSHYSFPFPFSLPLSLFRQSHYVVQTDLDYVQFLPLPPVPLISLTQSVTISG